MAYLSRVQTHDLVVRNAPLVEFRLECLELRVHLAHERDQTSDRRVVHRPVGTSLVPTSRLQLRLVVTHRVDERLVLVLQLRSPDRGQSLPHLQRQRLISDERRSSRGDLARSLKEALLVGDLRLEAGQTRLLNRLHRRTDRLRDPLADERREDQDDDQDDDDHEERRGNCRDPGGDAVGHGSPFGT